MKYLFLIIRHFFPRRRWVTIETHVVQREDGSVKAYDYVQRDQFGNLRTFRA